ncbi:T9SS type A sorting domain-containing protein [Ichthyenterobacterium sp. W332]|uniref:T9SS type A sorting domain-containing protein n=1 Tax=Microcosmobacter mediterraneus TaxID=3075607 RepID=A0ABU2YH95_9FLAO|nr:T9SS type A sorting domain-containing protein [Ichthyenterobacterium sp. W332]MDT0557544.1 T9SS type A sorting domain-containing protein [Ichthyenterobacterium sp. W332]
MKKITLLCFAFFAMAFSFNSSAQCTYTIEYTDTFGDGWNGVSNMDVLVNGAVVLDDVGIPDGGGATGSDTFMVNDGDVITTVFNPAAGPGAPDYTNECGYRILDLNGIEVYNANFGAAAPGDGIPDDLVAPGVTASCAVCTPAVVDLASLALDTFDCDAGTFSFTLELDDLGGAASVTVTNNASAPDVTFTAIDTPETFSGFPTDTDITLTVVDDEDSACDIVIPGVRFSCPPANDDCINASTIVPSMIGSEVWTVGDTRGNTASGETDPSCGTLGAGRDLWYVFEVPVSGEATITTRAVTGSPMDDTVVTAYTGSCGALIEFDADGTGANTDSSCNDDNATPGDFFSELVLSDMMAGDMIYVRVSLWNNAAGADARDGEFEITIAAADPTLSTLDAENENAFTYYPNPVNNKLTLNAANNIQNVAVYNMLGQEVMRATPNNVDGELDMSSLQTGAYFVKVTINDVTETVRILKQ